MARLNRDIYEKEREIIAIMLVNFSVNEEETEAFMTVCFYYLGPCRAL